VTLERLNVQYQKRTILSNGLLPIKSRYGTCHIDPLGSDEVVQSCRFRAESQG
jgi:hypothetical protein